MADIFDLHSERAALMNRIVGERATERGIYVPEGVPPDVRNILVHDAERADEEWFARIQDGELATPSTPVEYLLAEVYALDHPPHEAMEGGRGPGDTLQ